MPPPYQISHWNAFSKLAHMPTGAVGRVPTSFVMKHGLGGKPAGSIPLPSCKLDRSSVRGICQNPANPVLFGYICAMAWGGQSDQFGNLTDAWANSALIAPQLQLLRAGGLSRAQAYKLFTGPNHIRGLGPAFFTKLLYFFSPSPDFYIMDQWTGKSVDLLTGTKVVRMAGDAVSSTNACGNYQAYCEEVDTMALLLGIAGEDVEEMLMSKGGRQPWAWRQHVRKHWPGHTTTGAYNPIKMHAFYPHISPNYF
jgi:hypothetical protein